MNNPKRIEWWDWKETITSPYDGDTVPALSQSNLEILAERYNELIDYLEERGVIEE